VPAKGRENSVITHASWWEHFFEGVAVNMWLKALPAEFTRKEAEGLIDALGLPQGAEILDVPSGAGRLALPLAAHGYRVTGVDWSTEFLAHARAADQEHVVSWERRDMRALPWTDRFDGAFCAGNSFGYFDDEGNLAFVKAVAAALKPGARFVLDTPMVLENLLAHIQDRGWWNAGGIYLLAANQYDPARGRLDIAYTFIEDGRIETRHGSHRAYTYQELVALLEGAGFSVKPSEPWTKQAHSVRFIATREP
jgi:SAM-dependent methyltransferase